MWGVEVEVWGSGLRPSRNSQLSRLLHLLSDEAGRTEITKQLATVDTEIKKLPPIVDTQKAITGRHKTMLGDRFAQELDVQLAGSDFPKLAARLSLIVDALEIDRNGLGYNKELDINYRSVPAILHVANELTGRKDKAHRDTPTTLNGAFYIPFKNSEKEKALATFRSMLQSAGIDEKSGVVVCRSSDWAAQWSGSDDGQGVGIVKSFASATICRDKLKKMDEAFHHACAGIVGLLADQHSDLMARLSRHTLQADDAKLRRAIWQFVRDSESGLPSGKLSADTEWHPRLSERAKNFVSKLASDFGLTVADNLGHKLARKSLDSRPLIEKKDLVEGNVPQFRVSTVHKVKGESLEAVMYVANKEHVRELLDGTKSEVGRIGYFADRRFLSGQQQLIFRRV